MAPWALLLVVAWALAPAAGGQTIQVASDDAHLWVAQRQPDGVTTAVYHLGAYDETDTLEEVEVLQGIVQTGGRAAAGNRLWLVYADGTLQVIRARESPIEPGWVYEGGVEGLLPHNAKLRGMTASADGPWVLVTAPPLEDEERKTPVGSEAERERSALRDLALGLPPGTWERIRRNRAEGQQAEASEEGEIAVEAETPPAKPGPRDQLLALRGGQWVSHPMPADWPGQASPAWVVAPRHGESRPTLVVLSGDRSAGVLWVYQPEEAPAPPVSEGEEAAEETPEAALRREGWSKQEYRLPGPGDLRFARVQGQLVVCHVSPTEAAVEARATLLRNGETIPLGQLSVEAKAPRSWGVVSFSGALTLVVQSVAAGATPPGGVAPTRIQWTRLSLTGEVLEPATELPRRVETPWSQMAEHVVLFGVLLAVVLMVLFLRRDPAANRLALPSDLVLADFGRRAIAGAIDVAPAVFLAMRLYDVTLEDLLRYHWPGRVPSFSAMVPGAVAIGLFVAHTTLCELLFARSLGKMFTSLRVADLRGRRPRAWQVVVRGLLKSFDMVAWLLLILPILGPFRQRLGDLLARTVVVMPKPEGEEPEAGDG